MQNGKRTPLITVVIPTYGRNSLLEEALASVLGQTVEDFECIVVDDASPEPITVPRDLRLMVLRRQQNGGGAAARNSGIDAARGEWITFLDSDDRFAPRRLEIGLAASERADVAVCQLQSIGSSGRTSFRLEGDTSDVILDGMTPNVGQAMVRRSLTPLFDERLRGAEDVEWWLRLSQTSPFACDPRVGVFFRHHDEPRHGNPWIVRATERESIMQLHESYFATHRRARSFQLLRIAEMQRRAGNPSAARRAARRSFSAAPSLHNALRALRVATS